jgi:hypothetical protein
MTSSRSIGSTAVPLPRALTVGAIAGLAGGIVFGALMAMQGMLPMIAALVGADSGTIGLVVHLAISAAAGLALGAAVSIAPVLTATPVVAAVAGALYGVIWWVGGALIAMPTMLGMGEMVLVIGDMQVMSLVGHLIFGVATGLVFHLLVRRGAAQSV